MTTTSEAPETWRVECEDGEVREVEAWRQTWGSGMWCAFLPGSGNGTAPLPSPRAAVAQMAGRQGWPVVAVLAPGQPTRAEVETELRDARAEVDDLHGELRDARREATETAKRHAVATLDAVARASAPLAEEARRWNERATELETERECMVEMLGMARANFRTLAALVSEGNITAARAMIAAIRSDGDAEDGVAIAEVGGEARLTGWVVQHLAMATAAHLDALPAPNHCAWAMEFPARVGRPARTLDLVAQWSDGETTVAKIGRLTQERDALRSLLAAAARGELPRCRYCPGIATWMVREGSAERYCDKCFDAPSQDGDLSVWHQPAYAAALRAAMGGAA